MEDTVQIISSLKPTVIPVILKGLNYRTWQRTTKTAICGRGLWEHILEDKTPSEEDAAKKKDEQTKKEEARWFQEDQLVLGFLQNSLDPSILEAYSHCETAKSLWDTLKKVYGDVSNLSRVYEVKKAISELRQEDHDFTKYLGKFSSARSELDTLQEICTLSARK